MTYDEILKAVQDILASALPVAAADCVPGARLGDDLRADTLDKFEIMVLVEEKFSIDVEDGDVESWVFVKDIVHLVASKTGSEVPL